MSEKIYTQGDMDVALAAIQNFKKEAEQSKQLLWAVVAAAGGTIAVPYTAWQDDRPEKEIVMWDSPASLQMYLQVRLPDEEV